MEEPSESPSLAHLRAFSIALHHQLDQVQALVADLHTEITRLVAAGLVHDNFFSGAVIFTEPVEAAADDDSGFAYQATLCIPGGFGAAQWDSEEFFAAKREGHGFETQARSRNLLFDRLPPRVQARLLSQIRPLWDRWLMEIGAKQRDRPRAE